MDITVNVTGEREVALKFEQFPQRAHAGLLARITDLTAELEARVKAAEPSRTGKLRSETTSRVSDRPERIRGIVTIVAEQAKAGALEYGAHRPTTVRAHDERLSHVFGRLVAPLTVFVSEHSRRVNIAEHRFLRGPLEEMNDQILEQLQEALTEAIGV